MDIVKEIFAGDSMEWTESNSNFPASQGWTLNYILINQNNKYIFASTPSVDDHLISLPSSTTASWQAGIYTAQCYFQNTNGTIDGVARDTVEIKPNLMVASVYDTRTHAAKMVDAIEAALESGVRGEAQIHIQSEGEMRSYVFKTLKELVDARNNYRAQVLIERQAELVAAGKPAGKKILLSF